MTYIDGFVAPVLPGKREAYAQLAREASKIFLEHGAIQVVESLSDDVPHGKVTDFYRAVAAEENEAIAFSWIVWPSKEARDAGMAKVMADDRMKPGAEMPFDMKRMIFGGYEVVLDTNAG
ncbi:MAG: DUF1428 domain-containing protein [Sphingomonas sp.]|jgi:uncharacterized protein YbaA (DUF1428 family)|nr:DUF1428 domain-containing protein [Sphingomonas sp.]